jgi:hypothetical protein
MHTLIICLICYQNTFEGIQGVQWNSHPLRDLNPGHLTMQAECYARLQQSLPRLTKSLLLPTHYLWAPNPLSRKTWCHPPKYKQAVLRLQNSFSRHPGHPHACKRSIEAAIRASDYKSGFPCVNCVTPLLQLPTHKDIKRVNKCLTKIKYMSSLFALSPLSNWQLQYLLLPQHTTTTTATTTHCLTAS